MSHFLGSMLSLPVPLLEMWRDETHPNWQDNVLFWNCHHSFCSRCSGSSSSSPFVRFDTKSACELLLACSNGLSNKGSNPWQIPRGSRGEPYSTCDKDAPNLPTQQLSSHCAFCLTIFVTGMLVSGNFLAANRHCFFSSCLDCRQSPSTRDYGTKTKSIHLSCTSAPKYFHRRFRILYYRTAHIHKLLALMNNLANIQVIISEYNLGRGVAVGSRSSWEVARTQHKRAAMAKRRGRRRRLVVGKITPRCFCVMHHACKHPTCAVHPMPSSLLHSCE